MKRGNIMSVYRWVEGAVPCGLEVKQVYGIVFAEDGRILLRKDNADGK